MGVVEYGPVAVRGTILPSSGPEVKNVRRGPMRRSLEVAGPGSEGRTSLGPSRTRPDPAAMRTPRSRLRPEGRRTLDRTRCR